MMFKSLSALALVALAGVQAQDATSSAPPVSTSGISACTLNCITTSATANGCSDFTDIACLCSNQQFQQAAASCLTSQCSSEEVQAALALQAQQCAAVSGSSSAPAASATSSGSEAVSSAASSATSLASSVSSAVSSASSAASSLISSASSAVSSGISSVSRGVSSATAISSGTNSASGSGASASQTSNAASVMYKASFGSSFGGVVGVGVALAGVVLGAGLVL
ncbi:hypothetical protein C8Q77DRAFT_1213290 [Trametes polyzona]|nr:hypothetical protein C8Q77DRAFT_1213290 [Trametes polyzona]